VVSSNINRTFFLKLRGSRVKYRFAGIWGKDTVTTYRCVSVCLPLVITMSEQLVPLAVAQRIVVEFLTNENVKPPEILMRL